VTTAAGVLANDARLAVGESVVVLGSGGVGLAAVQLAALGGAFPIVAVDLHANRLERARAVGATHTISGRTSDLVGEIQQVLSPSGADIVLENTGDPDMIAASLAIAGRAGRVVLVGVPPRDSRASIDTLPLHFDQRLCGSHGGGSEPATDIPRLVRLIEAGRLNPAALVARTYPLAAINDAIADMRSGALASRPIVAIT
jgi:S-(hydroxymethyl)glutathione dehydrogenase/alcohol dehydrogenase